MVGLDTKLLNILPLGLSLLPKEIICISSRQKSTCRTLLYTVEKQPSQYKINARFKLRTALKEHPVILPAYFQGSDNISNTVPPIHRHSLFLSFFY